MGGGRGGGSGWGGSGGCDRRIDVFEKFTKKFFWGVCGVKSVGGGSGLWGGGGVRVNVNEELKFL